MDFYRSCETAYAGSQMPTYHDSSDANAHIPDDVQFTVEEVFNARLTVLHFKDIRGQEVPAGCLVCAAH